MRILFTLLSLFISSNAYADWPIGSEIDQALLIDITDSGFEEISKSLPVIVPDEIPLDTIYQDGDITDVDLTFLGFTIADADLDWYIEILNLVLGLNIVDMQIRPGNGVLWLDATLELNINDSVDMASIIAGGELEWSVLWWTETERIELLDCGLYTEPFTVEFSTSIGLQYVDDGAGGTVLDADIGTIVWDWDLRGDDVEIDCWVGDILDFLDSVGLNVIDLALNFLEGEIDTLINDLSSDIEPAIEDAMSGLSIEQQLPIGEAVVDIKVQPNDIEIIPDGMRISALGYANAEYNPCIGDVATDESVASASATPTIGNTPSGVMAPHHFGIMADDDFVNHLLFAVYYGGGLCFKIGPENDTLPLNTALLGILAPGVYDELFPEPKDVVIQTRPTSAPVAYASGDSDVNLDVDALGLDIYADLDYRTALIVGLDLDIDAGVDLNFDDTAGQLDILVKLGAENISATARHNEFAPGYDEQIADSVTGLFDTLVGPLLDGLLGDLSFPIPSIASIGLTTLEAAPSGPAKDWFGFYANTGVVTYGSGGGIGCNEDGSIGCEDGGGCDPEAGCDSGGTCTSGAIPARGLMLLLSLIGVAIRRRSNVNVETM